jgi:hypothetical protein
MTSPDLPVGGTTGHCHESSEAITIAARWIAENRQRLIAEHRALVPAVREAFGLGVMDAVRACAESALYEVRGR